MMGKLPLNKDLTLTVFTTTYEHICNTCNTISVQLGV